VTARVFSAICGDIIMRAINQQPTPVERLDFARIAHAHDQITDAQLAVYEEQACVRV
jgi:hypothetical protein